MNEKKRDAAIFGNLLLVVLLWGGNNCGTKWLLVNGWTPLWTGGIRFLLAGFILLALLRWTRWLGNYPGTTRALRRQLWWRGGLSLAVYVVFFCWALKLTAVAHVALYIGASPVWVLLVEGRPGWNLASLRRYGAALLALGGVLVLFWPALKSSGFHLGGEICGLLASVTWAAFNFQGGILARDIPGVEVAANSMWMAGALLLPFALWEIHPAGVPLNPGTIGVQAFNILLGSVVTYTLWNSALRHWPTSRVMIFSNAIPLTTAVWAHFFLHEPFTANFFLALALIFGGVLLGQVAWERRLRENGGVFSEL